MILRDAGEKGRRQRKVVRSRRVEREKREQKLDEPVHVHVVRAEVQGDQELEGESPGRVGHSQEGQKTSSRTSERQREGRREEREPQAKSIISFSALS